MLSPLTAVRGDDGVVRIRNGQRRTLGAREVGLSTIPVYVLPATVTDDAAEAVERIEHQIVTNDQADALTDAQRTRTTHPARREPPDSAGRGSCRVMTPEPREVAPAD